MDEWKATLRKRFVAKYGSEPEEDFALWRIWKKQWEKKKEITSTRYMPSKLRRKIRDKIDAAEAVANKELEAYKVGIDPQYSMPRPKKWHCVQRTAAYKAKMEFYSIYGIYPYEDPTKVKVWCAILDKCRREKANG